MSTPKPAAKTAKPNTRLVRLKPYDRRRRHVMRVYVHGPTGKKFEERKGWYKVDASLAKYLGTVQQIEGDEDAPFAFDVCSAEEAKRLDERERRVRVKRAESDEANDLTTGDLHGNRRHAGTAREAAEDRFAARRGREPVRRERSMRVADATDGV
jgi:hypothetical protein